MLSAIRRDLAWRLPLYRRWAAYLRLFRNGSELIRFERSGSPVSTLQFRHGAILHVASAAEICQIVSEVWLDRVYTRWYAARSPVTVVDIGANIGTFTLLAKHLWPACTVHAYEPDERNRRTLQRSVLDSGMHDVHVYPEAVADVQGWARLHLGSESGHSSLYAADTERDRPGYEVETVDLETVLARAGGQVDFLKMDCEGGEWAFLRGRGHLLPGRVSYAAMELHCSDERTPDEMLDLWSSAGFQSWATPPDAWRTCLLYAASRSVTTAGGVCS